MTGKKRMEAGKRHRKLIQPKPDHKKWKEKVKFLAGLAAETMSVQAELMGEMNENHLRLGSEPSTPNLHALQLTQHQLRDVNMVAILTNDEVEELADEIIAHGG